VTRRLAFTLDELDLIAAELPAAYRAVPVFAALTGLRPCEWMALERGDVDRGAGVVTVRRTVVDGVVKPYGKTERSLRSAPLPARAAQALDLLPPRLDTRLLFPGKRGGPLSIRPSAIATGTRQFGRRDLSTERYTR
jgi:integrase